MHELFYHRALRERNLEAFGILQVIHAQTNQLLECVDAYESGIVPGINRGSNGEQKSDKESQRRRILYGICKVWTWDYPRDGYREHVRLQSWDRSKSLLHLGQAGSFKQTPYDGKQSITILAAACGLSNTCWLIAHGMPVPGLMELDKSPQQILLPAIHFALLAGHIELAKSLWQKWQYDKLVNPDRVWVKQQRAYAAQILAAACTSNQPDLVRYFLECNRVFAGRLQLTLANHDGGDTRCVLQAALSTGSLEMLRVFRESKKIPRILRPEKFDEFNKAMLCSSIVTGQRKLMDAMLDKNGARNYDFSVNEAIPGVFMESEPGCKMVTPLIAALISGQEDIAGRLLALNANPNLCFNIVEQDVPSPLYWAAKYCSPRVFRELCSRGASLDKHFEGVSRNWEVVKVGLGALEGAACSANNGVIEILAEMKMDSQVQAGTTGSIWNLGDLFQCDKRPVSKFATEYEKLTRGEVAHLLAISNCYKDTARLIVKLGLY